MFKLNEMVWVKNIGKGTISGIFGRRYIVRLEVLHYDAVWERFTSSWAGDESEIEKIRVRPHCQFVAEAV